MPAACHARHAAGLFAGLLRIYCRAFILLWTNDAGYRSCSLPADSAVCAEVQGEEALRRDRDRLGPEPAAEDADLPAQQARPAAQDAALLGHVIVD